MRYAARRLGCRDWLSRGGWKTSGASATKSACMSGVSIRLPKPCFTDASVAKMRPPTRKSTAPMCEPSSAPSRLRAPRRKSPAVIRSRTYGLPGHRASPRSFCDLQGEDRRYAAPVAAEVRPTTIAIRWHSSPIRRPHRGCWSRCMDPMHSQRRAPLLPFEAPKPTVHLAQTPDSKPNEWDIVMATDVAEPPAKTFNTLHVGEPQ